MLLVVSEEKGGAGNPSPVTAYGVFMGLKAATKHKFGSDNLNGKSVLSTRYWSCWRNFSENTSPDEGARSDH